MNANLMTMAESKRYLDRLVKYKMQIFQKEIDKLRLRIIDLERIKRRQKTIKW